jgi:hypothetical protein
MSVTFSITSSSHGTAKSYSVQSGLPLPQGLTLSTRGTLSGTPTESGNYIVRLRGWNNANLSGDSAEIYVPLTVVSANPPVFTSQPTSVTVAPGQSVSLTASFKGDQPLTLRWFKEDLEVKNATNATLTTQTSNASNRNRGP